MLAERRPTLPACTRSAAALMLLAGTACCKDDPIKTVVVLPQNVLTAPNVEVQFQAWAIDTADRFIQPTPPARWQGSAAFTTGTSNPTRVAVASDGDHLVKAKIGKHWSAESVVRGRSSSIEVSSDAIEIEHASPASIADVLVDAMAVGDPDCGKANDRLFAIAKVGVLPQNLVGGCGPEEIAIFAHDRAPLIEALAPATWTTGAETLQRLTLPAVVAVPTAVWYFVSAESPETQATVELDYANWAHAYNRAGVRLAPITHHPMGREEIYPGPADCAGIEAALGFVADPGHLHIVYVADIDWSVIGWACPSAAGRGDIVLITWNPPFATILTHEVVHQMGHSSPPFPFATAGHVDGYAGFDVTNLMYINNDPLMDDDRFSLTLGQVYRMHAASHSWINRGKLRPPGSTERPCHSTPDAGVCPQLSLRGWRR